MPTMDNGLNAPHYQQQMQHQHLERQPQQFSMLSPAPVTCQRQISSNIYPTTSSNTSSSMKRGRVCSEESSASFPSSTYGIVAQPVIQMANCEPSSPPLISATPKKARSNNYRVPRSVKPSILTAMGTLAGGNSSNNGLQGSLSASVPMRRRLSGGHLDKYIGEHDNSMDIDTNRPRSMSF